MKHRKLRKSNKQRRAEIKIARLKRAKALKGKYDVFKPPIPRGAELADYTQLNHVCPCTILPLYYVDHPFICRDCGAQEVWTASQQKWWYEVAKGRLDSIAVRCRPCRKKQRARKAEARAIHLAGLQLKQLKKLRALTP